MTPPAAGTHDVWLLTYPGVQPLDVVGPHEVFAAANLSADARKSCGRRYQLHLVGAESGPVRGESGLALHVDPLPAPEMLGGTMLVPGGFTVRTTPSPHDELIAWMQVAGASVDRLMTVCTGAFLAASAGLLSNSNVATHWAYSDELATAFPGLQVDRDAIWIRDGDVWSSAGVTAGMDLALAIVENDHGSEIAQEVARWLVVFLRRPGGQSQFAAPVWSRAAETPTVRRAQDLIHTDPAADLSVEHLALTVGMSARHLTRRFQAEVGETPARYIETVRLEAARQQLQTTDAGMTAVARHCGFGTAETLRRSFQRRLGVSPDDYRKRFKNPLPVDS